MERQKNAVLPLEPVLLVSIRENLISSALSKVLLSWLYWGGGSLSLCEIGFFQTFIHTTYIIHTVLKLQINIQDLITILNQFEVSKINCGLDTPSKLNFFQYTGQSKLFQYMQKNQNCHFLPQSDIEFPQVFVKAFSCPFFAWRRLISSFTLLYLIYV